MLARSAAGQAHVHTTFLGHLTCASVTHSTGATWGGGGGDQIYPNSSPPGKQGKLCCEGLPFLCDQHLHKMMGGADSFAFERVLSTTYLWG